MHMVNMVEAKSSLSKLVAALEQGSEQEIIIARNGKPVAKLVSFGNSVTGQRIGIAKGQFVVPDDFDADDEEIARLFLGDED